MRCLSPAIRKNDDYDTEDEKIDLRKVRKKKDDNQATIKPSVKLTP